MAVVMEAPILGFAEQLLDTLGNYIEYIWAISRGISRGISRYLERCWVSGVSWRR
jgi:hypothetical protein